MNSFRFYLGFVRGFLVQFILICGFVCFLRFYVWKNEFVFDSDKDFILDGLCYGFKFIFESDIFCIDDYELDNYSCVIWSEFKSEMDFLF